VAADAEPETPAPLDAVKPDTQTVPGAPAPEPGPAATGAIDKAGDARRPGHLGLSIQFDARPDDLELGRLVESTVWVNVSHPAYRRAAASRAEGYHVALTVALALAPLAVEPAGEHGFVSTFLACWGEAVVPRPSSARARRGAGPRSSPAAVSRQS
jgi:hypothetical protein